ncbi:hypothetical protein GCM10017083_22940 [Thalassobaculum fulvum]|uniref:Glycosyltransferase 2-like domain-containing protein n=1 Tax=Thalassobaculum fulvum TaxID=1633335 RepID=A0A918XRV7_9PROT|nr:glycosyltransferase [Thalassobaculum fulvum]GHD49948.1 hypothetical protein GCM10017083_22940 [Thalassobaculum fulvum]
MRYKLARPKDLPDAAGLRFLEVQVDIYRKMRGTAPNYTGMIRNEAHDALLALGTAYHFRGEDEKAIEVLEELAADQDKVGGLRYLAVSYERLHRYKEAIATHRKAVDRAPTNAFHLGHLGRLLCLMGQDREALGILKAGQKAAPYDAHIRSRLASVRSRLTPGELDESIRRPAYSIIVVLGDRSNFSEYQTLLEALYRRMHKIVLVVDADDVSKLGNPRGDGRLDLKAWVRRHPGVDITDHATIHRRRLARLSRLLDKPYATTEGRPWIAPVSKELRGWTLKMAADLMLVCLDRTDPMFAEAYVQAADDAGYLICGLSVSDRPTAVERRLDRTIPRIRCVANGAERVEQVVALRENSIVVHGDLTLEPAFRPVPDKTDFRVFDQIFPTLAGTGFVLYMADPACAPLDELRRAGTLAARLRQSNRMALRRLAVVYRSAMPARLPFQYAMPDNLVLWPRPDASQDSNTAVMLRVGIQRATAVVSHTVGELGPAVMGDRPAIVLETDGSPARVDGPYASGTYRCDTLGEAVRLLGDIVDGCDPAAAARSVFVSASDLAGRSRFSTLGDLLGHGVELVAGGETVERVSKLLLSEFHDALGASSGSAGDGQGGGDVDANWFEAADRALAAAGSALTVAPELRAGSAPLRDSLRPALDAAAALVRGLERSGLTGQLTGESSNPLLAQLLGGIDFPEGQVQSALLLKAVFPDLTIYLVDVEERFEEAERAVREVFPDARIANAVESSPGKLIRSLDFVYTLDKRLSDIKAYVPSVAIAQSALSLVPEERALILATRLAEWSVPFLALSIDAEHPRAARYPQLSAALRRSFRLTDLGESGDERYLTSVAVSRSAVMKALSGRPDVKAWPQVLGNPSVTIGLVVYNGAEALKEALESVLAQTYWDYEVIVVDNGSTDATLNIARSYADRDPRISIYPRPKNVGAVGNFRFALSLSRGRYFCWASDHDVYDEVWLERMVRALEGRPNAVLAYPYFGMIDDRGARVGDHLVRFDTSGRTMAQRMRLVTDRMRGSGSKVYGLYRRAALDQVRVRTTVWWDRLFLLELAAVGEFVQVNEVLWWRRYKGILRDKVSAPDVGKFGLIPDGLSTKDTVVRQLKISFEDGRPPFLMRMATLANAVLLVWDTAISPPGRRGVDLRMLPLALRSAYRAMVRTKSFIPAEFQALREHVLGRH